MSINIGDNNKIKNANIAEKLEINVLRNHFMKNIL